jgi:predicted unusual protein kinase regulating ubiquinone biosynthesis (AarF/ABC1/UbiB family)
VGQSLSIRTDLLSPAYIRGLETLQDQVPAFDTAIATRILEQEWGRPVSQVLAEPLSSKPIAAASLGQVYKAKLKPDGEEVAIKVQRPDITEQIALDMYLVRNFAIIAKSFFNLNTDTVGTVDAWGVGFVDELDYLEEARNAEFFSSKIAETPLREVVFAPTVVDSLSTRCVLVSEWVDGERLDRSTSEDVSVLCSIAMNTYLTMLLEMSILHCDPHPGNLLRVKKDGRLCILDWGMVTRLEPGLQLTLIEHMAHLTSSDYAEIPRDLLLLGFIPESKADLIEDSGVVDVLADIYGAWSAGGGAAAINVPDVINQLQDLTSKKGNLFQIPPYFAYIAKSFSVLEGIGLSNDPKYSIINECLPYVSNRLITDKENMGPALSTFIFGPEKSNKDRIVSYKRVKQLMEGFGEFSTSSSGALLGKNNFTRTELLDETTDQIMDLLFSDEETPLQQILLEQVAKVVTSSGRYILTNVREQSGILPTGRTLLGTLVDPLGFWRTSPLVRMNELDEKTINTTRQIVQLFQEQAQKTNNPVFDLSNLTREETAAIASMLVRK